MKLQSFLKEESLSDIDISEFTENLDPKHVAAIKKFLEKFKRYSKITLNDVSSEDMFFHVSNNLVDFDFSFGKDTAFNDNDQYPYYPTVEIAAMVNHTIVFNHEKMQEHDTHKYALSNTLSRDFDMVREARMFDYVDAILKIANEFEEWYFDIAEAAGKKVKLIKITEDLERGHSNNTWKWTPYLGQFFVEGNDSTARVA